ncbi:MAG: redoxin domain-containing protein [Fibrobacter sp.]|nr:redoxin domain-containing protein [Fibrobacter sp.]
MKFVGKAIAFVALFAVAALAQVEVKQEVPELLKDSSGTVQKMDFTIPLAGINDPGMLFSHFSNKPLLIFYFSPKCPHCQANFPQVQSLIKEYESKGLNGLAISIGGGIKKNDVRLFIDQFNASMPIFQDVNAKFGPRYGTGYVPVIFLVNKDGTFYRFGDSSKKSFTQLKEILDKMFP